MTDREKVMKGLEICTKSICSCDGCPYLNDSGITCDSMTDLMRDALALLKEQEPRLMTLDEVLTAEDFVWAEIYTPNKWSWCVIYVKINPVASNDEIVKIEEDCGTGWTKNKADYGKRGFLDGGWRCWTSRPTEEQRRETKWEEDNETV